MENIKKIINAFGKHYVFTIIDNKAVGISVGHDQYTILTFARFMMDNLPNVTCGNIYYLRIIVNDMTVPVFAPVILKICECKLIDNKLKITSNKCSLWLSNDDVLNGMFEFKNIRQIITKIHGSNLRVHTMKLATTLMHI